MTKLFVALATTMALAAGPKDVTGVWNMSLQFDHVVPVGMELMQDGGKVTGKILLPTQKGDRREVGVAGDLVDGKLTLAGVAEEKSNSSDLRMEATLDEDGTLSGTISMTDHAHPMKWTAERLKAKK